MSAPDRANDPRRKVEPRLLGHVENPKTGAFHREMWDGKPFGEASRYTELTPDPDVSHIKRVKLN